MLQIGDTFIQNGLTYVVKGKDGAGRPVSSCKPEDVEKYKKVEEPTLEEKSVPEKQDPEKPTNEESTPEEPKQEESPADSTQAELPFVDVPNPTAKDKKSSKKAK